MRFVKEVTPIVVRYGVYLKISVGKMVKILNKICGIFLTNTYTYIFVCVYVCSGEKTKIFLDGNSSRPGDYLYILSFILLSSCAEVAASTFQVFSARDVICVVSIFRFGKFFIYSHPLVRPIFPSFPVSPAFSIYPCT